jgi:hypothetical protein
VEFEESKVSDFLFSLVIFAIEPYEEGGLKICFEKKVGREIWFTCFLQSEKVDLAYLGIKINSLPSFVLL